MMSKGCNMVCGLSGCHITHGADRLIGREIEILMKGASQFDLNKGKIYKATKKRNLR